LAQGAHAEEERRPVTGLRGLCVALFAGGALSLVGQPAQGAQAIQPLVGIWGTRLAFAPGLHGELTIIRNGSFWHATLAGAHSTSKASGDALTFVFPNGAGRFRGHVTGDGSTLTGFWLQPAGDTKDPRDPGGSGQAFASPLTLTPDGPGVWRAAVRSLEDRFTLYLRIFPSADGSLVGAFRNPDMNSRGGASQFRVTRLGNTVRFTARPNGAQRDITLSATIAQEPERLRIFWPDLGRIVGLQRLTGVQAADFFPRPPGHKPYVYRMPPAFDDGWQTARARDEGIDEAALARVVQELSDANPAARRPSLIHSILVARHGKLVLEEYFFGFDRDQPHDVRSAGKTFASAMVGTAMRQGTGLSPATHAYALLARMGPFANPDPRKSQITIAQLMTHTSGLACDDNDDQSPGNEGTMQGQLRQPDWWKYTLDLPVVHDPGTRYAYCSAGMNLVGAAVTTATGTWLPEYFDRTIAQPLQFGPYYWNLMPTGEGYLGGGAYLRPRDLLKVGQTYLDGGAWRGRRIVDASWVALSTAPHVTIDEASTGLSADDFPNFYVHADDGYAWHVHQIQDGPRTYREYEASGNGGQLLIVIPALDMAVVFTAGNYGQGGIWGRFRDRIVMGEIAPAIKR
jgi:CubicO group peptidase (beta-lactamase class C family)